MNTYYECLPCLLKQALSVLSKSSCDRLSCDQTLRSVLQHMSLIDFQLSPPAMAKIVHRIIRDNCANPDPFLAEKQQFQQLALRLLPQLEQQVFQADDPLQAAVQLAIAGNSIDLGIYHDLNENQVLHAIEQGLNVPLQGNLEEFRAAAQQAHSILYLGDNAGEIVLDTLLLKQLPLEKITFAVRGAPILNDALFSDAEQAGITELVPVIDNGDDAPGTLLESCSPLFKQHFNQADMIIAKGQGNYETLSESPANLFFLLKAKCPVVARHIGCELGASLLHHSSFRPVE